MFSYPIHLTHHHAANQSRHALVRVSVPFPLASVCDRSEVGVRSEEGAIQSSKVQVLSCWPDDSIRWCLVEFEWHFDASYAIIADDDATQQETTSNPPVHCEADSIGDLKIADQVALAGVNCEFQLRHDGVDYRGVVSSPSQVVGGPIRWTQQWQVNFRADSEVSRLAGQLTASVYASFPVLKFEFQVRNPQPMDHPGGNWDLGANGSILIDDLSVNFVPECESAIHRLSAEFEDTGRIVDAQQKVTVFQASSGGDNWNSANHLDRGGRVPLEFCGYKVFADADTHSGLRAQPIVRMSGDAVEYSIAYRDFWQNFPSALSTDRNELRIGLLPAEATGGHELQGGEQKTFEFGFEMKPVDAVSSISAVLNPPMVRLAPDVHAEANAVPYLLARSEQSDSRYEALVDLAIEGDDSFFAKREKIDQYGWRNFGDIYGDHEAVYHKGESLMISHYNNQYDCTLGFAIQFLRSGDSRWFDLMTAMADHAWDIDTYHTEQDKLLYNGGLFWHTYHYADAHTATHRSYPKRLRVSQSFDDGQDLEELGETGEQLSKNYAIGGGPAASHNYNTGWMLAYWLTGKQRYREAAINAADYVLRIEDGNQTPFKWLCRSDTGYSTCSSDGYYGPGRASGNSTHALLTGHELTADRKYLDRAALLMRRTVHPKQDLKSLDLLNAELRWFYTMYLQALGRYVDYKMTLGELDADFRYGVATLRHYARWMARNERPILSDSEKLQYPTETWAAQDMRKWHVLEHAARYESDDDERKRMWEKADYFFNYVVDYLTDSPTKSLCRPVVLLLNFGWQREWLLEHRDEPAFIEKIDDEFGEPQSFVPQRTIALHRFKRLVVLGAAAVVSMVVLLIMFFIL
ncbi:hypothetical protein Q31b_18870 [Novipirellula aureliae]|uniref:Uncharacterized protein n=1 Tax=Novipirellula aureliae TaxID=2527966 RepID=A0A5C6E9E2_9BACT|nr:hypothetical protein [Novipirellula aureliae]TWU44351.1 hypothetical protein Q31b_18870 [Novipirellula aureliae]